MSPRNSSLFCVAFALALGACSKSPPPVDPAVAAKAVAEASAAKEMVLYDQMRTRGSWDLATTLGNEVLARYPGTQAAVTVQKTLDAVRAKSAEQAETRRLARLWIYTAVPEAGGTQYAAAIVSKQPLAHAGARIRLVLRQHPKWGQSVYLLLDGATFDCRKGCATLAMSFDGKPAQRMRATIPPTGEPALFIDDDKGFIAKLEKAKTVAIDVTIRGEGDKAVEFEIGGFDAAKLPDKPKK
jgi:hypothetical protein